MQHAMDHTQANTIQLLRPQELRPHEAIIFSRALSVLAHILWAGAIRVPILIDSKTGVILDGHHRWWVSKRLGLAHDPCYCVDYLNDGDIRCEPRRAEIPVTKELVISTACAGVVFPAKTTRHIYQIPTSSSYSVQTLRH